MKNRLGRWVQSLQIWPIACGFILAVDLALRLVWPQARGQQVIGLFSAVLARGCVAVATILVSRRVASFQTGRSIRFLAISLTLWVLADGIGAATTLSTDFTVSQPTVADLLRLAGYLSAVAAFGTFPSRPRERFSRLRESLDVAILCLAVLAFAWLMVIHSVLEVGLAGPIVTFWAALAPVMDLVIVVLLLRLLLLSSDGPERVSFTLLGAAFLVLCALDLTAGYSRLLYAGQTALPVAGGSILASLLMVTGVIRLRLVPDSREGYTPVRRRSLAGSLEPLMPIGFTYLVVGSTALNWWLSGRIDGVGLGAAVLLSLLLVARQGVIAGQVEFRQFAALVNSSADMAFVARSDGRLILENPALRHSLGTQARAETGRFVSDFVVPERPLQEILDEANESGWSGEARFRRSDATTIPVYLSLRPVYDERRSRPLLAATAHDLTRIKSREEELQQALREVASARSELEILNRELEQKVESRTEQLEAMVRDLNRLNQDLKELDRLKTEFVALVSHELRTPLTSIQTGVELILTSYPKLKGGARESMELVQAETTRLTEFVETILDLSALEAGRFPIQLSELDLAAVAAAVTEKSFSRADRNLVTIQFPTDLPPVKADRRAVGSVLFHLIDNALKYAPGQIVAVSAEVEDGYVAVSVTDQGPGVPSSERERVFEMFHRLDASDSREVYGHGLGLHLVKRFVETMGGDVRIEDGPQGGARVIFRVPRCKSSTDLRDDEG